MARKAAQSPPVAVIDIGTNTVLLLVRDAGGTLLEDARITRLGSRVFETGRLDPAAAQRTAETVREFAARARSAGASAVVGVATEALRAARGGSEFLESQCESGSLDRGLLLSGEEEASLTIEAQRRGSPPDQALAVIDVGGGSTELAWTGGDARVWGQSLPLGSVRYTEGFLPEHPIPADRLRELRERVRAASEAFPHLSPQTAVWAVAGTATTLAALELQLEPYDAECVEALSLSRAAVERWLVRLAELSVPQRSALPGLEPARADIIVAGLAILAGVLERIGATRFRVSERGVRHGVALRLLDGTLAVW